MLKSVASDPRTAENEGKAEPPTTTRPSMHQYTSNAHKMHIKLREEWPTAVHSSTQQSYGTVQQYDAALNGTEVQCIPQILCFFKETLKHATSTIFCVRHISPSLPNAPHLGERWSLGRQTQVPPLAERLHSHVTPLERRLPGLKPA